MRAGPASLFDSRVPTLLLGASIVLAGCAAPPLASESVSLVNGSPSTEAAVVAVIHTRPATGTRQLCTGTLVAPTVVVTAKHCVFEDMGGAEWVANPVSTMSILLGDSVSAAGAEIAVTAITTTPGPYHDGDGALGGDIAVLTLASAPPGITPALVTADAPTSSLGLSIAGFGYTGAGSTGTLGDRNAGTASVTGVAAGTFTSEGASWTCTGDSGGPAFRASDGRLIGVTSIGPRGCPASTSIYTRIDANVDLLTAAGVPVGGTVDAGTPAVDGGSTSGDAGPAGATDTGGVAPSPPAASCGCRAASTPPAQNAPWMMILAVSLACSRGRRARQCLRSPRRPRRGR